MVHNKKSKVSSRILTLISLGLSLVLFVGCNTKPTSSNEKIVEEKTVKLAEDLNQYPLTIVDLADREVTFESMPERIVTVVPSDMEIIYALGGEVVGRPLSSSGIVRPEQAATLPEVGYPLGVNFEVITSLEADMFIGHARLNLGDVQTLESLGIEVVLTKGDSLEDIKSMIKMYGHILERQEEALRLIDEIDRKVTEMTSNKRENPIKALILFGTRDETMAALPQSLAGNLFELAGAQNISDGLPRLDMYPTYAQLSLERVLEADPDVIYFMAHGDAEVAKQQFEKHMADNPGWNNLTAVKKNNIIVLPHELFGTNPGPRIVDALDFVINSLNNLEY